MWDFLITVGSLGAGVYFLVIEPWLRRRRERQAAAQPAPLPPPRNPPPEQPTERQRFDALLQQLVEMGGEPVHEPGTDTPAVPAGTPGNPDTNQENERYQRVLSFVREGYSGNQICELMGGKRADTLALVRRARQEIGA